MIEQEPANAPAKSTTKGWLGFEVDRQVFLPSTALLLILVLFAGIFPQASVTLFAQVQDAIVS